MLHLKLYSTSHCHLCEQAEALLVNISKIYDINWQIVEIAEDSELIENYGLRIPVIKRMDNNTEINWPFSAVDVERFITAQVAAQ